MTKKSPSVPNQPSQAKSIAQGLFIVTGISTILAIIYCIQWLILGNADTGLFGEETFNSRYNISNPVGTFVWSFMAVITFITGILIVKKKP